LTAFTVTPRARKIRPNDATTTPFPTPDITPPVTTTSFGTNYQTYSFKNKTPNEQYRCWK
jgi:hypothetical protein